MVVQLQPHHLVVEPISLSHKEHVHEHMKYTLKSQEASDHKCCFELMKLFGQYSRTLITFLRFRTLALFRPWLGNCLNGMKWMFLHIFYNKTPYISRLIFLILSILVCIALSLNVFEKEETEKVINIATTWISKKQCFFCPDHRYTHC